MAVKLCKKIENGRPCPNVAIEGKDYCGHHLSKGTTTIKTILNILKGSRRTVLTVTTAAAGLVAKALLDSMSTKGKTSKRKSRKR